MDVQRGLNALLQVVRAGQVALVKHAHKLGVKVQRLLSLHVNPSCRTCMQRGDHNGPELLVQRPHVLRLEINRVLLLRHAHHTCTYFLNIMVS